MNYRTENDSLGSVKVPSDKYWGAQTQRSLQNFRIEYPEGKMPIQVIHALAIIKKAAAQTNFELGVLPEEKKECIVIACDEIIKGKLDDQFPLQIWQTGSGTQTNMNVNEVIANRVEILHGGKLTDKEKFLHPNDDVNKSQSSNDTFPSAMSIAAYQALNNELFPKLELLYEGLLQKSVEFEPIIKIGRTHTMDATPLTLGMEFSGYASQLYHAKNGIRNALFHLGELALGGTAVGTGINAPKDFGELITQKISHETGIHFISAPNKFEALASCDSMVELHGALKVLAVSLMKIANDIRFLGSGPRAGIGELILPANEPGSSIMPGKVNPTQAEALSMVCAQVLGNDVAINIGGSNGHFELNVFRPMIIYNVLQSIKLLADACESFNKNCIRGIKPNQVCIKRNLENSLMLVTALVPYIGYDKAAEIAKKALSENITLREAAVSLNYVTTEQFDEWADPAKMI
jgi:fumarate hydratase class II